MALPPLLGVEGTVLLEVSVSIGSRFPSVQQLEHYKLTVMLKKQAKVLQDLGRRVLRRWR